MAPRACPSGGWSIGEKVRLVGFAVVNPLVPRFARRLRDLLGISSRQRPSASAGPSPYTQWHGPSISAQYGLTATAVADIVLLQGAAPAGTAASVEVEGSSGSPFTVSHRFPHPDSPTGPPTFFELTLDASLVAPTSRCRLVAGEHTGEWIALPDLPAPGSMTGEETIGRCPACMSVDFVRAGRRQHLEMATCTRCGLMMTTPRPVEDHTLMRYSERYFSEEYLPAQELTPALLRHIDSILDLAEPIKADSATLFELGIGGGNLSARAAERGWKVSGTDVNPASVAHATSRGLHAWLENADHADSLGGPYGVVVSEMSLEHVRHPEHFCRLATEALVPGGRLIIYTVSAEGDSFEHSGMASPLVGPAEHLFLFSAGSLVSLCHRAGLRVESLWRNPTADEIGIVATKRRDVANPAAPTAV